MTKKVVFLISIIFGLTLFPISEVFALENLCNFENSQTQEIPYSFEGFSPWKTCNISENTNFEKKLIHLEIFLPEYNDELFFILIDSQNRLSKTSPISEWYDLQNNKLANIALDPLDFNDLKGKNKNFNFDQISQFLVFISNKNSGLVEISNPQISSINDFENFEIDDNIPIQNPVPGFLILLLLSFPLGFVILNSSGLSIDDNFFIKLPWFLSFGFIFYMVFSYLIAYIFISTETFLTYLVISWVIFGLYVIKKRDFLKNKIKFHRKISIVFLIFLCLSALVSISYSLPIGWPTGNFDPRNHVSYISVISGNNNIQELNFNPVSDLDFPQQSIYPKGSHVAGAGLSLLTGIFPATSFVSLFSFIVFLIPSLFASLVFKYTKSIFLSSLMFVLVFWRPLFGIWYGDIMYFQWARGNLGGEVGALGLITFFMIFLSYFESKSKIKIFSLILITIFGITISYYVFSALPIFLCIIGFVIYYIRNTKKLTIILSSIVGVFLTIPLWAIPIYESVLNRSLKIPYHHWKYLENFPFDPNTIIFPFWISVAIGFVISIILLKDKKLRFLGIIFITVSLIHILSISEDIAKNYFFYYKALRSLGVMFLLSIVVNLVGINYIINKKLSLQKLWLTKSRWKIKTVKNLIFIGIIILLLPSFGYWYFVIDNPNPNYYKRVPGGNEKFLYDWIYENTSRDELILNDHSDAAQWLIGQRPQSLINGWIQDQYVVGTYNPDTQSFEPTIPAAIAIVQANQILKNPWDYEYIKTTIKKLDIKYLYISERTDVRTKCALQGQICYPDSEDWAWKTYSGNSRIGMYEHHPNLELVLRNGNSAIFRVI